MWARDRCCYVVGREGIEPPQSKTADLQSAELTTCSTYPLMETAPDRGLRPRGGSGHRWTYAGADDGTRTRNRRFTKPLLYQLSYVGARAWSNKGSDSASRGMIRGTMRCVKPRRAAPKVPRRAHRVA